MQKKQRKARKATRGQKAASVGAIEWNAIQSTTQAAQAAHNAASKEHQKAVEALAKVHAKAEALRAKVDGAKTPAARKRAKESLAELSASLRAAQDNEKSAGRTTKMAASWLSKVTAINTRAEKAYSKAIAAAKKTHDRKAKTGTKRRRTRKAPPAAATPVS